MKCICLFLSFLCMLMSLNAQQPDASPIPVLPSEPLLNAEPDFTKWTVTSQGKSPGGKKAAKRRTNVLTGTRTREVIHIVSVAGNGGNQDLWSNGRVQVITNSKWQQPVVSKGASENYQKPSWVSQRNFTGIEEMNGKKCLVFHDKVFPGGNAITPDMVAPGTDLESLKVDATAYIDTETRLPVLVKMGGEKIEYKFEALPPDTMQTFPAEVEQIIAKQEEKIRAETRQPVTP